MFYLFHLHGTFGASNFVVESSPKLASGFPPPYNRIFSFALVKMAAVGQVEEEEAIGFLAEELALVVEEEPSQRSVGRFRPLIRGEHLPVSIK